MGDFKSRVLAAAALVFVFWVVAQDNWLRDRLNPSREIAPIESNQ